MSFQIVLYQPVIPQNTGSIARLCACTGATLHLIHPLGFNVDDASVQRAGLDYWPHVDIRNHQNWFEFLKSEKPNSSQLHFYSKKATRIYTGIAYRGGDYLVFGNETQGLPPEIWSDYAESFALVPMRTNLVRSLNLSQCAAVVIYEAIRQCGESFI